jgi:hypothetical protein
MRGPVLFLLILVPAVRAAEPDGYSDPAITADEKAHWSFRPPVKPKLPAVKNAEWVKSPIDAFILAKLEAAGLSPSPEADKRTLIRRVTLDLTGLPPSPADVDAFLADKSRDAYEKVVDRLLASPHFGERQAQHWLDVVRFAESNGYEADGERPHAWRYRDYVVRSFNEDKPYSRFLTEQIAGDELAKGKPPRDAEDLWVATGMHRCGPVHMVGGNLEQEVIRQELLTEMVNGFGSAVLGLTVGCARCHDHKFDPVSQGDYYRLQAFFNSTKYTEIDLATAEEKAARSKQYEAIRAEAGPLRERVSAMDAPIREKLKRAKRDALEPKYKEALDTPPDKRTEAQKVLAANTLPLLTVRWDEILAEMPFTVRMYRAVLRHHIHELERHFPSPDAAAWAIQNTSPQTAYVFKRGNPRQKLAAVTAAFPRVLVSAESQPKSRTELAKWVTQPDHPLTARVMVNRSWQQHFGRGIVPTPNDFGIRGERPTHPELLDWLAVELTEHGWSLKHLHRVIVLSATYRQSAERGAGNSERQADGENKLLGRMNHRRLEAEAIRDSILFAAGALNPKRGGPSIKVPLEPEVYDLIFTEGEPDGLWPVTPDPREHNRRSIYLFNKRNVRLPLFEAFDQPDSLNSCAVRPVSTFAPQALILMNGPFVQESGKILALRLVQESSDPARQVESLYRRTVGRAPTEAERTLSLTFLKEQTATIRQNVASGRPLGLVPPHGEDGPATRALADLCVVMFNSNEFVYIP